MAITGRSFEDAARKFTDHLNGVLCKTLTQTRLQAVPVKGTPCVNIGFRQAGHPEEACFNSDYGWLSLSLTQNCDSIIDKDGKHELRTVAYWYYLYGGNGTSLMRWEFKRLYPTRAGWEKNQGKPEKDWVEPKYYARHHVQGDLPLELNGQTVSLNNLHAPTGYVPIEDIVRFCIEDLGAKFKDRQDNWHGTLLDSYRLFCQDFTHTEGWDGER
jgi:hypothetical protein